MIGLLQNKSFLVVISSVLLYIIQFEIIYQVISEFSKGSSMRKVYYITYSGLVYIYSDENIQIYFENFFLLFSLFQCFDKLELSTGDF